MPPRCCNTGGYKYKDQILGCFPGIGHSGIPLSAQPDKLHPAWEATLGAHAPDAAFLQHSLKSRLTFVRMFETFRFNNWSFHESIRSRHRLVCT